MKQTRIGISGGIGSGKSVVSRILRILGYPVFDCDSEAKALMDEDEIIKVRLREEICSEVVANNVINRARLAEIVFADSEKLQILNAIVHAAVRRRFAEWVSCQVSTIVFAETAILHSSGMIDDMDEEWRVTAPEQIRIERVMRRNSMTADQVKARIASQQADENPISQPVPQTLIVNDNSTPLLPQIVEALLARGVV